jgi:hypothetical protein
MGSRNAIYRTAPLGDAGCKTKCNDVNGQEKLFKEFLTIKMVLQ